MRDYSDISKNRPSGKRRYELSGVTNNGAFHMLGYYYSASARGARQQAKKDYGNDYKTYQATGL
jgi:hypothetical protein